MKEIWSYDDNDIVDHKGRFTTLGLDRYWQSIDAAVKYNAVKREQFLSRKGTYKNEKPQSNKKSDMNRFFRKYSKGNSHDEKRDDDTGESYTKRRKLPAPNSYRYQ